MKKMMRSTFGRLFNKNWVLVATLCICGASAFTSCSNNDDNPVVDNSLAEKIVGKWIHADCRQVDSCRHGRGDGHD